jgi:hypothetical protein
MKGNYCISLTFILDSGNPGMFYPVPLPPFDVEKETRVFKQIISTFQFLE